MTTEKQVAGYYDSVREKPLYEGDVFYDETLMQPFFRIVHTEDQGFVVYHVGSTETYKLSEEGALLVKRQYIGNEKENPVIIAQFKEQLQENAEAKTEEKPEEITNVFAPANEAQKEVLEKVEEVEKASAELQEANNELKSKIQETELQEEKKDDLKEVIEIAENAAKTESNVVSISDAKAEKPEEKAEVKESKNVIVEVAKEAVPEIIANTRDEKQAVLRKKFVTNLIEKNTKRIAELQKKVEEHTELASTLDYKPFVKLKKLVCAALHENVDEENIKDLKARTKDFESILNIQDLLKEHKQKAADAENEISDLEDENSKFSDELAQLEEKIDKFARQGKLPL